MTKSINQHSTLLVSFSLALLLLILSLDKCRCSKSVPKITDSTTHVAKYKKSILEKEVKILRDTQRIYIDKWRTQVIKGDSVYKYVYMLADDSCKPLIDSLNNQRIIEQNAAKWVIKTDSLIIYNLDSINKINNILIGRYKQDVVLLCDSINKVRRRGYWKGLKHGFVVGAGAVEVINLIK